MNNKYVFAFMAFVIFAVGCSCLDEETSSQLCECLISGLDFVANETPHGSMAL